MTQHNEQQQTLQPTLENLGAVYLQELAKEGQRMEAEHLALTMQLEALANEYQKNRALFNFAQQAVKASEATSV